MKRFKLFIRRNKLLLFIASVICNIPFNLKRMLKFGIKITNRKAFLFGGSLFVSGRNNLLVIGEGSRLYNCKFSVFGNNNRIFIGDDCELKNVDIWCADGSSVLLEKKVHVSGYTHLAATEGKTISINEDCLFSNNVVIRTGDSHSILNEDGKRINFAKDVIIGKHCWIGQNVTILKGTNIGNECIVGTGAILSGKVSFPQRSLIGGVPAKILKEKVSWNSEIIF